MWYIVFGFGFQNVSRWRNWKEMERSAKVQEKEARSFTHCCMSQLPLLPSPDMPVLFLWYGTVPLKDADPCLEISHCVNILECSFVTQMIQVSHWPWPLFAIKKHNKHYVRQIPAYQCISFYSKLDFCKSGYTLRNNNKKYRKCITSNRCISLSAIVYYS